MDFNPLPPHGGRLGKQFIVFFILVFQSTPSAWRETSRLRQRTQRRFYFNPLPPHGGRRYQFFPNCYFPHFNPLPPHGGRLHAQNQTDRILHFNPLPPHGGRHREILFEMTLNVFQSTPSAWRETWIRISGCSCSVYFNPLPPHGGRPSATPQDLS